MNSRWWGDKGGSIDSYEVQGIGPGVRDGRFSRRYSIVWLRELVLGLSDVLTTSKHGCTIPTLVDMGNSGLDCSLTRDLVAKRELRCDELLTPSVSSHIAARRKEVGIRTEEKAGNNEQRESS